MNKTYEEPKVEKIIFASEDIITTSGDGSETENPWPDGGPEEVFNKIIQIIKP